MLDASTRSMKCIRFHHFIPSEAVQKDEILEFVYAPHIDM